MNPEIERINERLSALESMGYNTIVNTLIQGATTVTDADVTKGLELSGDAETVNVLDFPDRWLRVLYNGKIYRVAAYLEVEDATR